MLDAAMNVHVERSLCVNIGFHFSWVYTWEWNPCCLFLFKRAGGCCFLFSFATWKIFGVQGKIMTSEGCGFLCCVLDSLPSHALDCLTQDYSAALYKTTLLCLTILEP
jgi:hypothetical protein